jgi:peptide/nickel transport system substrate-binding protein
MQVMQRSGYLILLCLAGCNAAPEPDLRDNLRVGVALEPPNLDPTAGAAAATDEIVYANLFEGLTRIDASGAVQPALARSWTVSPDGRRYIFSLRKSVRFHDGTMFDAQDVKYTLDRARAAGSTNAQPALFAPIAHTSVLAPDRVQVDLKAPLLDFPRNLAWGDAVIVAPESAATNAQKPIGTGPFRFVEWRSGESVRLARFESYWGKAAPLKNIEFKFIADSAAAFGAIMAGDVDGFANFLSPELAPQLARDPRFRLSVGTTQGETVMAMNQTRAPFNNPLVRQAVAVAIDRQAILKGGMFGYGQAISSFYPADGPAFVDLARHSSYNPTLAKVLLEKAGYRNGFKVKLALPPVTYARRSGEIIAAQLADVGITVELVPIEWAQWLAQILVGRDYDMTIVSHTEPDDTDFFARPDNYFGYKNAAFNQSIEVMRRARSEVEKNRALQQAQTLLAQDHAAVFLYQLPQLGVWRKNIVGTWDNAPIQANDFTAAEKLPLHD